MTDIYKNLEDSLYDYIVTFFPEWRVKFAFDNGPELKTPYLVIDVRTIDSVGREDTSSAQSLSSGVSYVTTTQTFNAMVRFEFVGEYDGSQALAEMAHSLEFNLRTQRGYEEQARNSLSLMKYNPVRRLPALRETDMYMYYQLDATFGYAVTQVDEQDYMEIIGIHGVYHDAGREPDHIIRTTIEIDP